MAEIDSVPVTSAAQVTHPGGDPRVEAFAEGPPGLPRKFAVYLAAAVLVLGVGGLALDRALGALGLNPSAAPPSTPSRQSIRPASSPTAPSVAPTGAIAAGDSSLMGLTDLGSKVAPPLTLYSGPGRPLSLPQFSGKAVVVTFFDEACDDICPVLASEIESADAALGPAGGRVAFITVNTDPGAAGKWPSPGRIFGGRQDPVNWVFASGTLQQLNRTWVGYGITVDVFRSSGAVAHNDLMYFIDPSGRLRYLSTPFANEVSAGRFTLPPDTINRWGHAIAAVATGLLP